MIIMRCYCEMVDMNFWITEDPQMKQIIVLLRNVLLYFFTTVQ